MTSNERIELYIRFINDEWQVQYWIRPDAGAAAFISASKTYHTDDFDDAVGTRDAMIQEGRKQGKSIHGIPHRKEKR